MNSRKKRFITCGMYAFTDNLRAAWQALFDEFLRVYQSADALEPRIRFDTDFDLLRNPQMLLGHTCGYPLMHFLKTDCLPVCVPLFNVEGCQGKYYSSHLITPANSDINTLADCQNQTVAINGPDSNSGMNVLRHAVSRLGARAPYFSEVLVSGSHLNSVRAVAKGEASLAAIDSISFALIKDEWPELVEGVRNIGFTEKTCGLPFVVPANSAELTNSEMIIDALNTSLSNLAASERNHLHLIGFEKVQQQDYQKIIELEKFARQAGYAELV